MGKRRKSEFIIIPATKDEHWAQRLANYLRLCKADKPFLTLPHPDSVYLKKKNHFCQAYIKTNIVRSAIISAVTLIIQSHRLLCLVSKQKYDCFSNSMQLYNKKML